MSCVPVASLAPVRSVSTTNLAEKSTVVIPPPDYLECLSMGAATAEKGDISQKASNHCCLLLCPWSLATIVFNTFSMPERVLTTVPAVTPSILASS